MNCPDCGNPHTYQRSSTSRYCPHCCLVFGCLADDPVTLAAISLISDTPRIHSDSAAPP